MVQFQQFMFPTMQLGKQEDKLGKAGGGVGVEYQQKEE